MMSVIQETFAYSLNSRNVPTLVVEMGVGMLRCIHTGNFRITGYEFGEGNKSVCIVGSTRGNEIQQMYACSQVIKRLQRMEKENRISPGYKILVVPNINPYSMNIKKRFCMPGKFTPHIRMMKTGFESVELAKEFGLPYVVNCLLCT